ncbi:MAG: hypothetical protein LC098_12625 [Burkholderiales bacterium]|nr:hypothetical protein [Burkholderiales bacterium]
METLDFVQIGYLLSILWQTIIVALSDHQRDVGKRLLSWQVVGFLVVALIAQIGSSAWISGLLLVCACLALIVWLLKGGERRPLE